MIKEFSFKGALPVIIMAIIYGLPIIITNSLYYDDIGRSIYGYLSWGIDGRPLSDWLIWTLGVGSPATDISPLPQILCLLIMALACYGMHLFLNPENRLGWLCFTPIFMSPFFIQNIAFKFDSLPMAASVILAILPLAFIGQRKSTLLIASTICVILSLSLYQASLSALVATCGLYALVSIRQQKELKEIIFNILLIALGLVIGYVIYSGIVIPYFVTSSYAISYNKPIGLSNIALLWDNIETSRHILKKYFIGNMVLFYTPIFVLSFVGLCSLIFKNSLCYPRIYEKIVSLLLIVISIIVILVSIPGPSVLLQQMPVGPRVFIGFGFALSCMFLFASWCSNRNLFLLVISLPLIAMFAYMATFSNAMKSQDRMTDYLVSNLSRDIQDIGLGRVETITIDGNVFYTPMADKARLKFPLMSQLIPTYFDGKLAWGPIKMMEFYASKPQPTQDRQDEIISNICSMSVIKETGLYKILLKDGDLVVSFNHRNCL